MRTRKNDKLVEVAVFSIAVFGLTFSPQFGCAEISVDSYCQLSVQSMQQEISNFQALNSLANQYKDDPQALSQQEEVKRAECDQVKGALYSSFGITAEEYVTYMGKNGRAVNAYLDANPDIKQQMDDLSVQIRALMEEYESLKGAGTEPSLP